MLVFFKRHWLKIGIWLLIILPLGSTLLVNILLLAYMYWPKDYDKIRFDTFQPTSNHAVVAAHGINDTPATWIEPLFALYRQQGLNADLLAVNWSSYARDPLRCAIDGSRIGKRIGKQLASDKHLKNVQLIAHSCGAFVIYNVCKTLKAAQPSVQIHTTYLDPVAIYGPLFRYGINHFGGCADFSEAYIDTGDKVAGSNERLPLTQTYDVTAMRHTMAGEINPHLWPTHYYRHLVRSGDAMTLLNTVNLSALKPAGVLEKVDPNQ